MILNLCYIVVDLKEKQVKRHREPISYTYSRKHNKKKGDVSPSEDDVVDQQILDPVSSLESVIDMIEDGIVNITIVDLIPINSFQPHFWPMWNFELDSLKNYQDVLALKIVPRRTKRGRKLFIGMTSTIGMLTSPSSIISITVSSVGT